MSFQAMTWAVQQKCGSASAKIVLLMLANHTNGHTWACNPRHKLLAEECEMSVETLKNHLKKLSEIGLISIVHKFMDGVQLPNQYVMNFEGGGGEKHPQGGGEKHPQGGGEKHPPYNQEDNQEDNQERDAGEPADVPDKPARSSRGDKTLKTYLAECKAAGVKPIPDDHIVRRYCASVGISMDMAAIAWLRFREEHTVGTRKAKRYADWPATFHNSVKANWYKLWVVNAEGEANWTSLGIQARRAIEAEVAA